MKATKVFEDPFRPIYEKWAVAGWLGAGGVSLAATAMSPYPSKMFVGFSLSCLAFGAYRYSQAIPLMQFQKSIKGTGVSQLTRKELKRLNDDNPGMLFLGFGFDWLQEHAQMGYTLTRHDPERLVPRETGSMGQRWIHGLGALKEVPLFMPMEHTGTHSLIVGTTGAGKTRTFDLLISQVIAMGHSVIIIDPKGDADLCEKARQACVELGRGEDFKYFHPSFPERSIRIDPLKNYSRVTELASRIASLIPSETGSDPFTAFSMMAVNQLSEGLVFIGERVSLVMLRRLLEGGMEGLIRRVLETHFERAKPSIDMSGNELPNGWRSDSRAFVARAEASGKSRDVIAGYIAYYRESILRNWPNSIVEGLISSFEHDASHFGKMVTSLMPVLTMLTSGPLGELLSPNYDDPDDLREISDFAKMTGNGQVAYLGLDSLSDPMVASAIGALSLSDLTAVAGERYNFTDINREVPVAVFVDEAAEVMNQPLIQLLNKGRGAKVSVFMATQTISDIADRLGSQDKAYKVLGNINNFHVLRCNDSNTQEYLANSFPEVVVRQVDVGHSSKNEVGAPLTYSGTFSESLAEETVPLVGEKMLACIPNLEGFSKVSAGRVLKWRVPILVT